MTPSAAVRDVGPGARTRAATVASVDVVFDAAGPTLPSDHRAALRDAIAACLPWLADDELAGIHPLRATPIDDATARLPGRARLVLRVGADRVASVFALRGRAIDVGGHCLRLGSARTRALAAAPTIAAAFVATMAGDDLAHQRAVERMLDAAAIPRRFICGRLARIGCADAALAGASVVLHELAAADSLRVQQIGLGPHRTLGCGLFVPYKTIAGLG